MSNKNDIYNNMTYKTAEIMSDNLDDPREAVLIISKIKLPNGKKVGILNSEILYEKLIHYALRYEKDEYRFNNSGYIRRCDNLIRRSQIKKKKKKKKKK